MVIAEIEKQGEIRVKSSLDNVLHPESETVKECHN
jgi:hypothetical protein